MTETVRDSWEIERQKRSMQSLCEREKGTDRQTYRKSGQTEWKKLGLMKMYSHSLTPEGCNISLQTSVTPPLMFGFAMNSKLICYNNMNKMLAYLRCKRSTPRGTWWHVDMDCQTSDLLLEPRRPFHQSIWKDNNCKDLYHAHAYHFINMSEKIKVGKFNFLT